MKYIMLNDTVVCVNDIRNVSRRLGDIYIDFKCGTPETLKIVYTDFDKSKEDFLYLCRSLKNLG